MTSPRDSDRVMAWAGVAANGLAAVGLLLMAMAAPGRSGLQEALIALFPAVGVLISVSLLYRLPLALRALDAFLTVQWIIFTVLVILIVQLIVQDCTPSITVQCAWLGYLLKGLALLLVVNIPLFLATGYWSRPAVRHRARNRRHAQARSAAPGDGDSAPRD